MKNLTPSQQLSYKSAAPTLIVFSHLRWHFVTQRPQHLLTRAAQSRQVFYWEEPWFHDAADPNSRVSNGGSLELLKVEQTPDVIILRPHFNHGDDVIVGQRRLLDEFLTASNLTEYDAWYYTPLALSFSSHLTPRLTIYDCMDELTAFQGASPQLVNYEKELFSKADVVFTGGYSLYEAKRSLHKNVHPFPSSIEIAHFAQATHTQADPADQAKISHPRIGFFGVLDERFDASLISDVAALRPGMNFVFIGPIVKIDPASLPIADNIHYLGMKSYVELPSYLAGWDAAILPFAMNDSTRFISPTKTPEYLAAGKRVVSTSVKDVVSGYGVTGLVEIAASPTDFAIALDRCLSPTHDAIWAGAVTQKLAESSWDRTWAAMDAELEIARKQKKTTESSAGNKPKSTSRNKSREQFDYVVVGAGFAGSVVAERLATQLNKRVLVIDKRPHIGGNTYDYYNADGVLVHQYGPHIFHTSSQKVVDYLSNFTEWRPYEHRVLAQVDGKQLPIPINLDTINGLYDLDLDPAGMEAFIRDCVETPAQIRTSEDIVVSRVGRKLYEKFFRNYTRKQWGLDPSQLDSCVAGRIPVRFDRDNRYFSDSFQAMPLEGFTRLFERMLASPNITVRLSTDYREIIADHPSAKVVYTGPIDEFFDYRFGPLPYRSLRFEHQTHDVEQFQPVAVVNYPNDHDYTRITEFKHLTGQQHPKTSIVYEYPSDEGEPYYPIPRLENATLYEKYRSLAAVTTGVYFCGRLANYKYFNMDQVVAQALHLANNIFEDEAAAKSTDFNAPALPVLAGSAQSSA